LYKLYSRFTDITPGLAKWLKREQVCFQPRSSAVNTTLPAFADAALLLLSVAPVIDRYKFDPARGALSSKPAACVRAAVDRRDRQTDGRSTVS